MSNTAELNGTDLLPREEKLQDLNDLVCNFECLQLASVAAQIMLSGQVFK